MKTCRKCGVSKGTNAFPKRKGGRRYDVCRECRNKKRPRVCSGCEQPPTYRETPEGPVGGLTRYKDEFLCAKCLCPDPDAEERDLVTSEILRDKGGNLLY